MAEPVAMEVPETAAEKLAVQVELEVTTGTTTVDLDKPRKKKRGQRKKLTGDQRQQRMMRITEQTQAALETSSLSPRPWVSRDSEQAAESKVSLSRPGTSSKARARRESTTLEEGQA